MKYTTSETGIKVSVNSNDTNKPNSTYTDIVKTTIPNKNIKSEDKNKTPSITANDVSNAIDMAKISRVCADIIYLNKNYENVQREDQTIC